MPNVDPKQVIKAEQEPSVEMAVAVATPAVDVDVEDTRVVVVLLPVAFLYQLAGSSPRHCPTVTDLYPCEYIDARM